MTKQQLITDEYAIYNSDCMEVLPTLKDESIDLAVYSPPFANLYTYSSSDRDMSNCDSIDEFLKHYEFLVKHMARVTKQGRINCIHITDLCDVKGTLQDFPSEVIKLHQKYGFEFKNRITVWKEPLKVRIRTMVQSLMHKYIMEDATKCFPASPDYILVFKKKGDSEIPVTHKHGIEEYFGEIPILPNMLRAWNNANGTSLNADELWDHLLSINETDKVTKLNHYIWQRYASSVWDDVREGNVLPYKDSKEDDDEKHVTPTQLDVIDRCVSLWSNPGEVVLTPFMGVGSEVFSPLSLGRKAIGIELKD
ncbi:MAG: site-specific DNA-methyltransferase, partial [Aureispira sp.]|nr:site-specific DNA-methyltransferase [Aureispira sp.]